MNNREFKKLIPFMEDLLDGKIVITMKNNIILKHRIKPKYTNTVFSGYSNIGKIKDISKTKAGIPSICGQDLYFYF